METLNKLVSSSINFFLRPFWIIKEYERSDFRPDLSAGLTVAVIMLPQAVAFALIAGLPPQMGLYAAIVASIIGGLWGSSNQLQTGPTNTLSLLVLSVLLPLANPGETQYWVLAGMLAVMVGLLQAGMGLLRLGLLVNFVSDSVIVGFTAGAGVLIFFNQLRNLFRLSIPSTPMLYETVQNMLLNLPEVHNISLVIGLGVILLILILRRINPRIPSALVAIVLSGALVAVFNLDDFGVAVVGQLPQGFPPFSSLPLFDLKVYPNLVTGALAIAAIGLVESMSIARSIASQTGQRLDNNQEFIGQGLANFASGIFSGYSVAGSFSRTAINRQAGARSGVSNVVAGLILLVTLLLFGSFAGYIPLTALAGVLIIVAIGLIHKEEIIRIWNGGGADRIIMTITLIATLTIPLEYAVLIGIVLSLGYYLLRTSMPRVRIVLPDQDYQFLVNQETRPECPQLSVIEVLGDLYFGAVNHVEDFILAHQVRNPSQRFLLLRILGVEHFDISGVHALERIVRLYRKRGGDVYISRIRDPVMEVMRATGFSEYLGEDHFLGREMNAIGIIFYNALDPAVCIYECPLRVLKECQDLPKRLDLIGESPHFEAYPCEVNTITPAELWRELKSDSGVSIIDVREPREFRQGHIQGAKLIPLPDILADPAQVPKDKPVVLNCRAGRRSTRVAYELAQKGYDNLFVLEGGILAWEAAVLLEAID